MTQGARSTRKTPKPQPGQTQEFSFNAWLEARGLIGEKRLEVGGEWFRLVKAATSPQLAALNEARGKGDLLAVMASLLVDPGEADELGKAFERQPQPIRADHEQELINDLINFLVAGDAGESSAS